MQHVKKQWLSILAYSFVGIDIALFVLYLLFDQLATPQNDFSQWGITPLVLGVAGVHALYVLFVFPLLRKRLEWFSTIVSVSLYAFLFATIIETSGNTNLVYRLGYALLVFLMGMSGPFAPIATIVLTWLITLFTYLDVVSPTNASLSFNIVINSIVTFAGLAGWLFFKRYYERLKDPESATLSRILEREQLKTDVILESITDGVMIINTKGTVQLLNESAANMLGWSKDEATRLDYKSLIRPVDESVSSDVAQESIIATTMRSHKASQAIHLLETKHGHKIYVDIVSSPLFETVQSSETTPTKQMVGVISVLRNVDEQKRQEQQRSDFISTASHEMRTPVASIQGYIELALNPKVVTIDEKAKGYLLKAHEATKHLGELFQDLLTVSKSDDGRLTNKPQIIEVGEFLTDIVEQNSMVAEKKGLKVVFDNKVRDKSVTPLMYVHADPDRLREVITNLFDNAVKYTPSGMITVGASLKEQGVVIRVSDTGMGIANEDIPHLFQKFYRTDNSATREIGGTGLGLYICKQIIEMLGGKIWVESTVGSGSTFYVEVPRVSPETVASAQTPPEQQA